MAEPLPQSPTRREPREQFAALPGPLQTFLLSKACFEDVLALYKKHAITGPTRDMVVDIIGDIDFGYRPFRELLSALTGIAGMSEAQAKKFAVDLAGIHYLPIADLIGADVWETIKSWGGDPKKFPVKKVETLKITAQRLVDDLLAHARALTDTRLKERLQFVLLSRVRGVRDDAETRDILTRSQKVGGVELAATAAEELLDQLQRKLATAQIVTEMPLESQTEERKNGRTEEPNQPATASKPLPPKPAAKPVAPPLAPPKTRPSLSEALPAAQKFAGPDLEIPEAKPQKDEEEIAALREKLAERIPKESDLAARKRTASVESTVRTSGITLDPALTDRFGRIVDARLRDIRDTLETKRLLSQAVATGGLSLAPAEADRLANLIEAEYRALFGQSAAEKQREAHTQRATTRESLAARTEARVRSEAQAAEARFHKIAEKSKHLEEREVLLPSITPSHESSPLVAQPPKPLTTKQLPSRPALKAVLSPASVTPPPTSKPKVEDVKVVRQVAGPIDELSTMSLIEFRRLSRDPREATLKIRDKIELLKEEGFERYLAAVRAWQSSEPNRTYLALTREALGANATVTTLIQQKSQANQPTITSDEFHAILNLNSQLLM